MQELLVLFFPMLIAIHDAGIHDADLYIPFVHPQATFTPQRAPLPSPLHNLVFVAVERLGVYLMLRPHRQCVALMILVAVKHVECVQ